MKQLVVWDIEVLKNVFLACCYNTKTKQITRFEISSRRNDLAALVEFFSNPNYVFVGYNCIHYDGPITYFLIKNYAKFKYCGYNEITAGCFDISQQIISSKSFPFNWLKFQKHFQQIDLMTMMASKDLRVGLKSLQVTMCYKNVQEMHVDWNEELPESKIDELIYYCDNDIGSTTELLTLLLDDIKLRKFIMEDFRIDCLSKDGVGIGVDIFTKYVCEQLGIVDGKELMHYRDNIQAIEVKNYIAPVIEFKTDRLNAVLEWYKSLVLDDHGKLGGKSPVGEVIIGNLKHSYGIGGLHSVNNPAVYESSDRFIIRDKDVVSFYPNLSIEWGFGPKGFLHEFIEVLKRLKNDRVEAKKTKNKTKDKTIKLAINAILGHLRNEYGPYYAPEANVGICVSGQLMLLMLIEECELNGISCISSNTDGATFMIPVEKEELFESICSAWEKKTRMELEAVDYEKLVIMAVNDYVAYKKGFKEKFNSITFPKVNEWIEYNYTYVRQPPEMDDFVEYVKTKGMFIPLSRLGKGLDALIIPKALIAYFGLGVPVDEFILKATNILDFVKFEKVGKQYQVIWNDAKQQQINRFYVSRKAPYLYKVKTTFKYDRKSGRMEEVVSTQNMLKGFGVQLINEYDENRNIDSYDVNYQWYINSAREIIHQLEPIQMSLF